MRLPRVAPGPGKPPPQLAGRAGEEGQAARAILEGPPAAGPGRPRSCTCAGRSRPGPPAPRRLARAEPAPGIALLRTGGSRTERSREERSRRRSARLPPVRAQPSAAAEKPRAPPGERRPAATAGGGRARQGRAEPAAGSGGGGRRVPANMALCRPVARPGWREEPPPAHTEGPASRTAAPESAAAAREGEAAVITAGPGRAGPALKRARVGKAPEAKGKRGKWWRKFYF